MGDRLSLAHQYISRGHPKLLVLSFAGVSKSRYYEFIDTKSRPPDQPKPKGRPFPGYSMKMDGTIILDHSISLILKNYRNRIEFKNAGGYQKLYHYIKRDYRVIVNPKKIYRLCKENKLLLPRNKKKIKKTERSV